MSHSRQVDLLVSHMRRQCCLSSASSRVTETVSMKMPCGECFQKCFRAYNMINIWLNTVMPNVFMVWLPKMTRYVPGYRRLYLCDRFFEQKKAENEDKNTHSLENNGFYSSISFVSVIQILASTR